MAYDRTAGETIPVVANGELYDVRRHVSYGQVDLFNRCGHRYFKDYIEDGQEFDKSLATEVGSAVHEYIADIEDHGLHASLEGFRDAVRSLSDVDQLKVYGSKDLRWWINKGLPNVYQNYSGLRFTEGMKGWEPVGWEVDLEYETPEGELFIGSIDRIVVNCGLGMVVFQDWKTGKQKDSHLLQLELYRVVAEQTDLLYQLGMGGFQIVQVEALYLSGSKLKTVGTAPKLSVEEAIRMIDSPRQGTYPFNGPYTGECNWCPYKGGCSVGSMGDTNVLLTKKGS